MVRIKNRRSENVTTKVTIKEIKDIEELILPVSRLKFCSEQLQNLNYIFTRKLNVEIEPEYAKAVLLSKSVTERLIQRLLCGVGLLDSRFATKFLITLHEHASTDVNQPLDYLIRLDSLSTPGLYTQDDLPKYSIIEGDGEHGLPGYAQILLHPSCSKNWKEFVNSKGYLRRDKIQTMMVELLSVAAASDMPNSPLIVDESLVCGSPGKVVDPTTLYNILHIPSEEHVFHGPAGSTPRFPDPRDFKLAIVDDPSGIRIRVGFHSPALSAISIDVRLMVAVGYDAWPSTANFPFRVSLGHSDCVLYYKTAQTGLYLTGYGVHSSSWQIRLPAAECMLENNYSQTSTIKGILTTLFGILSDINEDHRQHQISYKILSSYSLRSMLFYHLEKDLACPTRLILNWSPKYLSTHVLIILDNLIQVLRNQKQPNYFFPNANLLMNPGHLCEDDFVIESDKIHAIMLRFFDESLMSLRKNESYTKFIASQNIEVALLNKWKELIDGLTPPPSTRGRRICFAGSKYGRDIVYTQYTTRQLEYINTALKNMLLVRQNILLVPDELYWIENLKFLNLKDDPIEDVIYVLVTLIEQARDMFLENLPKSASIDIDRMKLKRQIDVSASKLVELVRKEKEIENVEHIDDTIMVKIILTWLYKGLDYKKYLAPVLRPYLKSIFVTSHGASWHLETIKNHDVDNEIKALGVFARLVNAGTITPAQGLVDSVGKNWNWAKNILKSIEEENIRLVFIAGPGKSSRHILALPENMQKTNNCFGKSFDDITIQSERTLTSKHYLNWILNKSNVIGSKFDEKLHDFQPQPPYWILKNASPLTLSIRRYFRMGEHRCSGDIFDTLLAMQKFNIVREVSTLLPFEERLEILEAIQKLTHEKGKQTFNRTKCNRFVQLVSTSRRNISPELLSENQQKYTPKEESAGIREVLTIDPNSMTEKLLTNADRLTSEHSYNSDKRCEGSLIGSCRATRIRKNINILHFQDYFKPHS